MDDFLKIYYKNILDSHVLNVHCFWEVGMMPHRYAVYSLPPPLLYIFPKHFLQRTQAHNAYLAAR